MNTEKIVRKFIGKEMDKALLPVTKAEMKSFINGETAGDVVKALLIGYGIFLTVLTGFCVAADRADHRAAWEKRRQPGFPEEYRLTRQVKE